MVFRYDILVLAILVLLSVVLSALGFDLLAALLLVVFTSMVGGVIVRLFLIKYTYPTMWVRVFHPSEGIDPDDPLNIRKPLALNGHLLATHHLDGAAYDTALLKQSVIKYGSSHGAYEDQLVLSEEEDSNERTHLRTVYIRVKPKHVKFLSFKYADPFTKESFNNGYGLAFLVKHTDVITAFNKGNYQYTRPNLKAYWKPSVLLVILAGYLTAGSGSYDSHYTRNLNTR